MPQPWLTLPKNGFGNLLAREEFQKVSIWGAESSHGRHHSRNSPGVIDIFPLNSELLAKPDNYPQTRKTCRYDPDGETLPDPLEERIN